MSQITLRIKRLIRKRKVVPLETELCAWLIEDDGDGRVSRSPPAAALYPATHHHSIRRSLTSQLTTYLPEAATAHETETSEAEMASKTTIVVSRPTEAGRNRGLRIEVADKFRRGNLSVWSQDFLLLTCTHLYTPVHSSSYSARSATCLRLSSSATRRCSSSRRISS